MTTAMVQNDSSVRRREWGWVLAVAGVIFWASSRSTVATPGLGIADFDKVAHFSVYGLLATLTVRAGRGPRAAWLAVVAVSLFGASDEWHQSFVPGRSCELADWVADTIGAALAVSLYTRWGWYRARLETALFRKARIENPRPMAPDLAA